jgi:hypothetical protein
MKEIDEFLRENKPALKDDPTFLLETRRRLEQVEGIKAEVDRQRSHGRVALIIALAAGLALGVFATTVAFLYPVDLQSVGGGFLQNVRVFLETWKHFLVYPVAALAVTLSLVLTLGGRKTARL